MNQAMQIDLPEILRAPTQINFSTEEIENYRPAFEKMLLKKNPYAILHMKNKDQYWNRLTQECFEIYLLVKQEYHSNKAEE